VRLVVTARRAHIIGLDVPGPVLIPLSPSDTRDTIWSLAAGLDGKPRPAARTAGQAAEQAIVLAKLAQRLPALLVADATAIAPDARVQMITVRADAMERFSAHIVDTLEIVSEARIPLEDGITARFCVFRDAVGSSPVAIILGEPDFSQPVAVRVHSACLTGDVFGSRRCDCGAQLKLAIAQLSETGGGVVLYLEQEGRGLGLANKMRAYELQDGGLDTMDANMMLGFDDDERDYGVAARMLRMIGAKRVLLLTNNPGKLEALNVGGVEVTARIPLHTAINPENRRYLATKAARAGHWLEDMLEPGEPGRDPIGTPS
jgi:GTP cyclohydrolase II